MEDEDTYHSSAKVAPSNRTLRQRQPKKYDFSEDDLPEEEMPTCHDYTQEEEVSYPSVKHQKSRVRKVTFDTAGSDEDKENMECDNRIVIDLSPLKENATEEDMKKTVCKKLQFLIDANIFQQSVVVETPDEMAIQNIAPALSKQSSGDQNMDLMVMLNALRTEAIH